MSKLIALLAAAVSAWLAWGAGSLHEKDPSHFGLTLPLALGAAAMVCLVVAFTSKAKTKAKAKAR